MKDVEYTITERDPNWGIELNNTRTYQPRQHGSVRIYLSEELVDLNRKVTLYVNQIKRGTYTAKPTREDFTASCHLFGDPLRLFPAHIDANW